MLLIWPLIRVCRFVHSGRSSAELIVISQESRGREVVSSGQAGSKDNFEIAATTFILLRRRNVTAMAKQLTVKAVNRCLSCESSELNEQNGGRSVRIVCSTHRKCAFKAHL